MRIAALFLVVGSVVALDNGLGTKPAMGWNSWNTFKSKVSAQLLKDTADLFVSLGLAKAGYEYVNTDDCWAELERDASGRLVPGANFPGGTAGMQNLSAYIKNKGLKFGIYGAAAETTCAGRAGSLYHEREDAATFAEWGVDYLKYDECGEKNLQSYAKYSAMRDALNATGRPIYLSFEPHVPVPLSWPVQVGNSWRSSPDITAHFSVIMRNAIITNAWSGVGSPGAFASADMLEVGVKGLTLGESRVHFALWCLNKSPLLIGADLRSIETPFLDLLLNPDLIAISQDALGVPGALVHSTAGPSAMDRTPGAPFDMVWPRVQSAAAQDSQSAGDVGAVATDCAVPASTAGTAQRWEVSEATGTVKQGNTCLTVDSAEAVPGRGLLQVVGQTCQAGSEWQQWLGLSPLNVTLGPIRFAANLSAPPGVVWFQGPTEGLAEPIATNHRCGTCCGANDTTSSMCTGASDDGALNITFNLMRSRCAADSRCAGFSQDADGSFRPVTDITSISDNAKKGQSQWHTWQSRTGAPSGGWCLATNGTGSLFLEACEEEPVGCNSSKCDDSRRFRQLWYASVADGQLLSSLTTSPVTTSAGPVPVNIPQCIATEPNTTPPPLPPAPPVVDPTLPLQVWAGPLASNGMAAVLVNAGSVNATVTATWEALGIVPGTVMNIRDAMHGKDMGTSSGPLEALLPASDAAAFILTPA